MPVICTSCGQANVDDACTCSACGHAVALTRASAHVLSPMSGFVGRQGELGILQTKLDHALAGRGSVVMLTGEAGIGKTRVAEEFAQIARRRGSIVLWGRCYEGEWSPPYGPWVEALGAYVHDADPERLRQRLGPGAGPLAQLVPEVRLALPEIALPAPLSPDEERYRLHDRVAQFLLTTANEQSAVLVLDDIHWADRDSLGLLRHVARFVQRARLVLVGIYRDPDPDLHGRHPLLDVLAILRREIDYERLLLRGLDYPEVMEYLAVAAGQELSPSLARAVYAETDGNPFYLREVLHHLIEEGKLVHRDGRWSTDFGTRRLGIPDGVRQVLTRRLSRLSEQTNLVLRVAAGFSGGFEFRVLQALTELPEEALLGCLDEALQAGLIRTLADGPVSYDFAHAIVRHTIYYELNPDRQARLHRRIATALEAVYDERALDHAAELAAQYHASAVLPGAERGLPYCLAAARQARYAHERAVSLLRMARDLAANLGPASRAEVLCELAIAEAEALSLGEAQQTVHEALVAFAEAGTPSVVIAEFMAIVARVLKDAGASAQLWAPLVERGLLLIGERLDPLASSIQAPSTGTRQSLAWARLMLLRTRFEPMASGLINVGRWPGHDLRAVTIARESGDEDDYARTLDPYEWRPRWETETILALARKWQRPPALIHALKVVVRDLMYREGDLVAAHERIQELLATSERYGSIEGQAEGLVQLGVCLAMLGELSLAQKIAQRARETVALLGSVHRLHNVIQVALPSTLAYYLEGDWPTLAAAAASFARRPEADQSSAGLVAAAFAVFNHARGRNAAEARRFLSALTPVLERTEPTMYHRSVDVALAATAVWDLGLVEFADAYRKMALEILDTHAGEGAFTIELTVARMTALLGAMAQAAEFFARARTTLDVRGLRPLRAIADYDEALALLRASGSAALDCARIETLLDAAVAQFRALGMDGWVERAQALRVQMSVYSRPHASAAGKVGIRPYPDGLTSREVEVLRLVAAGHTNKEIAAALSVSVPTVLRHITNIYGKIGARNRADATAYALTRGLASTNVL